MSLRVLLASSSRYSLPLLQAIQNEPRIDFLGLVSTPDRPKGRHATPSPNELVESLQNDGIPLWKPEGESELLDEIESLEPDLVLVVAYGRLLKRPTIEAVPRGWINLHFSLLPRFRGAAPVQRAILEGDGVFGFTFFQIDEGMDTGPIYLQKEVTVDETAMATEILNQIAFEGAAALPQVITMVLAHQSPNVQTGEASQAPKFSKQELRLDTGANTEAMLRQIRAFTRSPGVWFEFNGQRCIITAARSFEAQVSSNVVSSLNDCALLGSGDGAIEILRIKPEGKREMSGIEWLRGLRFAPGESRSIGQSL
jgi:methionyl-tRNA formyltransferase